MMRYPAYITNRPSLHFVIRIEATRERGCAHRRSVARGALAFPSDQGPVAASDEFGQSLQCVRPHPCNAAGAMPVSERCGKRRRIDRTIATRDRLAGSERQLGVVG